MEKNERKKYLKIYENLEKNERKIVQILKEGLKKIPYENKVSNFRLVVSNFIQLSNISFVFALV